MAKGGINKVILVGRIGQDPETRYTNSGDAVTTLSIATSESWKDKQTGEKTEKTEWHRVVIWRKLAEIAAEYCKKGGMVYIEGKLATRKWQDKEGIDRYTTEIIADDMQLLGGKPQPQQQEHYYQEPKQEPQQARQKASYQAQAPRQSPPDDFDDQDIPF